MSLKACALCKIEKSTSEFNKNQSKSDGLQTLCKICSRNKSKNYYELNHEKHKKEMIKRKKRVVKENSQYVWNYLKEHPCIDCGESDPIVLDLDHVRGEKKMSVCSLARRGNSLQSVIDELEKCEVRCSNCHRKKTAKDFGWYKNIDMGL